MNDAVSSKQVVHTDPEHGGIRLVVFLTMALGYLAGFVLIRLLLEWLVPGTVLLEFATVLSCLIAVPFALGCAYLIERVLKKRWTSGMNLELSEQALRYENTKATEGVTESIVLDWDKRVNLTRWYFRLTGYPKAGRERLVSDKWVCLACQMQQDESRLIIFTYMPPEQAENWLENIELEEPFYQISLAGLYKAARKRRWGAATRPEVPPEMIAGPDGRYWIAERRRWSEGLEVTPDDFIMITSYIEDRV